MVYLFGIPLLVLLIMFQTAIVSTLPLLHGNADIILLVLVAWALQERVPSALEWGVIGGILMGVVSAAPFWIPIISYLTAVGIARLLRRRVWQTPLVAMFLTTAIGSFFTNVITWAFLTVQGVTLPVLDSFNQVVLPAMLLNLLLALPVYTLVTDLARSVYPEEVSR
jgi:rod shape-determining protein MreD